MSDEMDRIMKKLKAQGITVSTTSHPGASFDPEPSPASVISKYAREHGIYHVRGGAEGDE